MPRRRQISSTPEEVSPDEEDELSDVPSDVGLEPMEDDEGEDEGVNDAEYGEGDEEEVEGEEAEVDEEEEEEEEEEDNEAEADEDYDQQSEEDRDVASSEEEEAESDIAIPPAKSAPTASRGGRVLRKQEPAPAQRASYRPSRLARPPPSDEEEDNETEDEEGEEGEEEDEDESDEVPTIPAITTTSKGRVSRKPVQLLQEMSTNQPTSRSSRRAAPPPPPPPPQPPPERPKIKLKINLGRDAPQKQVPMEEIKVESPPKVMKPLPKATKPEPKPPTTSRVATRTTKPPEIVVEPDEEEEEEESSSSVLEEEEEDEEDEEGEEGEEEEGEEEDISEMMDEDDLLAGGGTEMDLDEEEEEEDEDEELTERSRTGTPMDPTRMTKRQQAKYDEALRPHSLMSLPNETLRKRALTAEEIALRRSETARRRKNQSEQRLEEEKIETINRLLKPQAPRRRGGAARAESPAAGVPSDTELGGGTREPTPPPPPTKVRIVVDTGGTRVAIPERWMAAFQIANPRGVRSLERCGRCGKSGIYPVKTGGRACSLGCIKALQAGA